MNQPSKRFQPNLGKNIWLHTILSIGAVYLSAPVTAQIIPDATLGIERSQISPNVTVPGGEGSRIDGGAQRGANLFHSFQEFNVNTGQRVYFANPTNVQNIFSRITGGNASNINGTLGLAGNANLFLLNPNGILFGPNAQLDVRGSFLATTANNFKFADGSTFGATNLQAAPLLSMSVPIGVQYGANSLGTIQNRGNLTTGQDLTLEANNLDLQGQLQAGRDLNLQAQDTVQIRDTTAQPFLARSGRDLTIQGNQSVDILSLNHPNQTPFISGGNTTLISNYPVSTDAHFSSGGGFSVQTLTGSTGNLVSRFDPIFDVAGDYTIGAYTGASLQVTAGGNITYGNIEIDNLDPAINTTQPALILSAGGNITGTGGVSTTVPDGNLLVTFRSNGATTVGIITTQGGSVDIDAKGSIATGAIDTSSANSPGDVVLQAIGDIRVGDIRSSGNFLSKNSPTDYSVIDLTSKNGSVFLNDADLDTSNLNLDGLAGDIFIDAAKTIELINSTIQSQGNVGRIFLGGTIAPEKIAIVNSQLSTEVKRNDSPGSTNTADGGSIAIRGTAIDIKSDPSISLAQSSSITTSIDAGVTGDSGSISIGADPFFDTQVLAVAVNLDSVTLETSNNGIGNSGHIGIVGSRTVSITSGDFESTTAPSNTQGVAGDINILAGATNGTAIQLIDTNVDAAAFGSQGKTGSVNLVALNRGDIILQGQDSHIYTDTYGNQPTSGAMLFGGNIRIDSYKLDSTAHSSVDGGNIRIDGHSISLINQAQVTTDVQGEAGGNAGSIYLTGNSLSLTGDSQISAKVVPKAKGNAGSITLTIQGATSLSGSETKIANSVEDGARGTGGNIVLNTGSLIIADGASIDSTMSGTGGRAGDISITAADQITIREGAAISASNRSREQGGLAGNITLDTRVLKLDTNASITAETGSGGGGNIAINARDLLILRRDSQLSTTAGNALAGGNGGRITIRSPFVVAVPQEDSDIIANAFGGRGGTIKISANRVFGMQTRSRLTPDQLRGIQTNGTSDISASSDVGSDGQIDISTLQVDPSQGLAELPVEVVDPSRLIAKGCQPGSADLANRRSEFVITGRGGLPPSINDPQTGGGVSVPWVQQAEVRRWKSDVGSAKAEVIKLPEGKSLVEAQGIAITPDGTALLTAQVATATPQQPGLRSVQCRDRKP